MGRFARFSNCLVASVGLCASLFLSGCDTGTEPDDGGDVFGVAVTGDPALPYMAQHKDGGLLIPMVDPSSGTVEGAVFVTEEGHKLTVNLDDQGLPTSMVAGDWVIVFENVTPTQADVAIISPDGTLKVAREVQLDPSSSASQHIAMASGSSHDDLQGAASAENQVLRGLQVAGFGVDIAVCVTGGAMLVTTGVGALAGLGILLSCTNATLTFVAEANPEEFTQPVTVIPATGAAVLGLTQCGISPGGALSCLGAVLTGAAALRDGNAIIEAEHSGTVQLARGVLRTGAGEVKFTLTWDNTADLDLWVTDPCGETILWNHPASASRGRLDVDDTNGHGPENIFWESETAPGGRYQVKVDHYAGASPSRYQVYMQRPGSDPVTILAGIISSDQTKTIANNFQVQSGITCPSSSAARDGSSVLAGSQEKGD